ncbi:spore protease YyaC [Sporosarcina sp. P21c]|uniref:spore protease YyaC n=1 Tax=Sporosarcina TaxID=1569 RepID=UPI000A15CC7A|nr:MULTISPECIES: spore protease YyaC [Sporosarcina]ARJ39049.1 spore protease YyaC [Sporosarcina ureae]PIC66419.1 spore protease YyaC [Sporosarcina sp. P16a]PIC83945.1 spore protease YyaC [Sporosarcina sp. P1]PIC90330.1 spore protease YyaC [Sporosarcina sp. P21c]PIC93858.1 spore protease YyaC [Sporosarcina sp. P25]
MHTAEPSSYHYRISSKETGVVWKLSSYFMQHIPFKQQPIIFYCIGTDRSTGDSLGPLTGSYLSELSLFPYTVVGTLQDPLHALNLQQRIELTKSLYPDAFVVAIDACLSKKDAVGDLLFHSGPIAPGKAVGKELPLVGDVSVKGIVNVGGFMEQAVLQSTRLHLPFEMSRMIGRALQLAHHRQPSKSIYNRYDDRNYPNTWDKIGYSDFRQAD